MIFTYAQVVILACIVIFIVANIIGVYFYQETYNSKKININNLEESWNVISSIPYGNGSWWNQISHLYSKDNQDNNQNQDNQVKIKIIDCYNKIRLKMMFTNKQGEDELWTFYFNKKVDNDILVIKKQTLTTSKFKDLINKYIKNNKDLKSFENDFKKIIMAKQIKN